MTKAELFFDLIYILAITQLTQLLLSHLTLLGMVQTLLLLLPLWWAWLDTAWFTNWFDPDRLSVRLMLFGIMLLSLIVSASLPEAYGDGGRWVAGAYAAIQVGRTAFGVVALSRPAGVRGWLSGSAPESPDARRARLRLRPTFQRLVAWAAISGTLWVAGGLVHGSARVALWGAAVAATYLGGILGFYFPGLGRSTPADWPITGWHLAERVQLFILIALGESLLRTGTALGAEPNDTVHLLALVNAFLGSVALWWIYFDRVAEAAGRVIDESPDPGRLGRSAYSYLHLPMVAGIIATAVGDELTIAHPTGHPTAPSITNVLAGPALFLAGHVLFLWAVLGELSRPRLIAIGALVALTPIGLIGPPLLLAGLATVVLVALAAWDAVQARRGTPVGRKNSRPATN
ncbi:low temperature requirement protein A [Micromonospora sp. NPDC048930]|uniref:low temperature requirement protein A n=1 Tax=Micromonospora sp. NPDC048930 TaxID=3364261 RepID=UPI003712599A